MAKNKYTLNEFIDGPFQKKMDQTKLAESTKIAYSSRLKVMSQYFSVRDIDNFRQIGLNDLKSFFECKKSEGYSNNRLKAYLTAWRKLENFHFKKHERVGDYLRNEMKHIYEKSQEFDHKYRPSNYQDKFSDMVNGQRETSLKESQLKATYEFIKETGMRSGALLGDQKIKYSSYKGIKKEQVIFHNDGSVSIKNIQDKYHRSDNSSQRPWDLTLPNGHKAIDSLKKLYDSPGEKLTVFYQEDFEKFLRRIDFEIRRDPSIVEEYGNLSPCTPHTLRHNYVHNRFEELTEKGCSINQTYEKISEEIGHENPDTTRLYNV